MRDFDLLKGQLREKEQGVKSEIERVWAEWEDRCQELEAENKQLEFRLSELELRAAEKDKSLALAKKEAKALKTQVDAGAHETRVLQAKYEEALLAK